MIIARNEAQNIAAAILSVSDFCRQVLVLDTGSDDATPSIASHAGAEVHFSFWENDFSKARNTALKLMRSDWIFMLDSDEEADFSSIIENIGLFGLPSNFAGIKVIIENRLDSGNLHSEHTYTRIFRRFPGIYFEGKIHEQISPSILAAGFNIAESGIKILHHGYTRKSKIKLERNISLLDEELGTNPEDPWLLYHLAETQFAAGDYENASRNFIKSLDSFNLTQEQQDISRIRLAQISLHNNEFEKVFEYSDFISDDENKEGLRLFIRIAAMLSLGRYSEASLLLRSSALDNSGLVDKENLSHSREIVSLMTKS